MDERRRFFRIRTEVEVAIGDDVIPMSTTGARALLAEIAHVQLGTSPVERVLWRLLDVIGAMEREIELLHRIVMARDGGEVPHSRSVELSAGGIRLWGGQDLLARERCRVTLCLVVNGHPRVLHLAAKLSNWRNEHDGDVSVGFEFVDVDEESRRTLVSFVFQEQRKRLRPVQEQEERC